MTRRNVELVLLLVAAPVVALLFAMIAINQGQSLDMTTLGVPAAIFVAFVIAHLAVRKFAANADPALLPLSFALSGIGIAFVTSLAPNLAVGQVMWLFVGVACMVLVLVVLHHYVGCSGCCRQIDFTHFHGLLGRLEFPFNGHDCCRRGCR